MLKVPAWLLEQLAKVAKSNPGDALTQSNLDDLLHLATKLLHW